MALGASWARLIGLILRMGMGPALLGVALGIPLALAVSDVLRSLLYGVSARDAGVFVGVPVVLIAVAFAASVLPAWRAAKLDAVTALRSE